MRFICLLLLYVFCFNVSGQTPRPKLVVGIVVDQMRQDYLYRYTETFGEEGFKRLMKEGFYLANAHYNYVPTYTGPGHASVYTGTTPAIHGIVGNEWYDKALHKSVYCVYDETVRTVGSSSEGQGKMSPHHLLTTTITDELKLATGGRGKVISISDKDRGAILPGGHMADAAYWFDETTGRMITSTFYLKTLPPWVEQFNKRKLPDQYLNGVWNLALPAEKYRASDADNSPYEVKFHTENKSTFPYDLGKLRHTNGNYDLLSNTPFSNDLLTEMAKAALDAEQLGKDEWTDFLCISFSAPDKLGHRTGPRAMELQDLYVRLDRNLADLLKKLDATVGAGEYLVFLTSDHGVSDVPQLLVDRRVPVGYLRSAEIKRLLGELTQQYFQGKPVVEAITNWQIYLNHELFTGDPKSGGVEWMVSLELISNFLAQQPGIAQVYAKNLIRQGNFDEGGIKGMVIRGYHPKRSGDIVLVPEPNWLDQGTVAGTTHGSPYMYDTHVPVIFFGKGVRPGSTAAYYRITDIAPTLAILLKVAFPSGCTGQPITEITDGR
ncbi:MAG: alkaline phosphatase family protein [Cyclobacteriaceae bacterium]|nr:MAG: alkaline phosphatase family protein [Cyclobacteriaceae bacterium]